MTRFCLLQHLITDAILMNRKKHHTPKAIICKGGSSSSLMKYLDNHKKIIYLELIVYSILGTLNITQEILFIFDLLLLYFIIIQL